MDNVNTMVNQQLSICHIWNQVPSATPDEAVHDQIGILHSKVSGCAMDYVSIERHRSDHLLVELDFGACASRCPRAGITP